MGVEASFQAMPENCELFITARQDSEIADQIMSFNLYMVRVTKQWPNNPKWVEFYQKAKQVFQERPGLAGRYFYAGARTFDAIVYLLSPARRAIPPEQDTSLIRIAVRGFEALHAEAIAGQGGPINFVPASLVPLIVEHLNMINRDILHEHYDGEHMSTHVYKMSNHDEDRFETIWDEFVGMRDVYRAAADHNEAVICVID